MEKYTIGEIQPNKFNQFELIIVGDSNDGDYISTREFYTEKVFDEYIIDELIELLDKYRYKPRKFQGNNLCIPHDGRERCHSIESVEVNYYDNNGSVRPVKVNSGYYSVCHVCNWNLEECYCEDEIE